ncbi:LpxI family protein [Magnetococcales bacterium HHB-1]
MNSSPSPIGLIAGNGQLPLIFAKELAKKGGQSLVVAAHRDETEPSLAQWTQQMDWFRLGQFRAILRFFSRHKVKKIVFAGGIVKTKIWKIRPDRTALKIASRLRHLNDDHLLRAIATEVESHGFTVHAVSDFVGNLLAPPGFLHRAHFSLNIWENIRFGWPIAKNIGQLDIGQGIVVRDKTVIAVEAIEGTDAMIERSGALLGKKEGVLIKVKKPTQDQRIDMPALGPRTMEKLFEAGISTMAIEAGGAYILGIEETLLAAKQKGITLLSLREEDLEKRMLDF